MPERPLTDAETMQHLLVGISGLGVIVQALISELHDSGRLTAREVAAVFARAREILEPGLSAPEAHVGTQATLRFIDKIQSTVD